MDNFECDEYLSSENWNVLECWWIYVGVEYGVASKYKKLILLCRMLHTVSLSVNYIRILHTDLSVCNYIRILHTDFTYG